MKGKLKNNIYKIGLYRFFDAFIFAYVIERLFDLERGLSVQDIVYLEIIYSVFAIILEVPTGSIADKWSRKYSLVVSSVFIFFEFFTLIFAHNFWMFVLSTFVAAAGGAFSSGTTNALLYDSLKELGRETEFEKISGKIRFFRNMAHLFAALIGSVAAQYAGNVSTYWLSLISTSIAFFITLSLVEPDIKTADDDEDKSYSDYIKEAFDFIKSQPALKFVVFFGIIITASFNFVDEFWQVYLSNVKVPVLLFGVIGALMTGITSISGLFSYKLKEKYSYNTIFSFSLIAFLCGIILISLTTKAYGLIFIFIASFTSGILNPLITGYLHHKADSSFRATAESFQSLAERFLIIIVGLGFGFFSTNFSIFSGYKFIGVLVFIYAVYFFINKYKYLKA